MSKLNASAMNPINTSRRSFFLKGGVAVGSGLAAATAGAATLFDSSLPLQEQLAQLHLQLGALEAKAAIRQLHLVFSALVENQAYATVVELFADDASVTMYGETFTGKQQGVRQLFVEQYGTQKAPALHTAFQQDQSQQLDQVSVSADRQSASATFHSRVQVSKPLTEQSVLAQMARQQGMSASSAWENGKFVVDYTQVDGQWLIRNLQYQQA